MTHELRANVVVNEVLAPGSPVLIRSDEPLDPRSAQAGIALDGEQALVRLSADGRTASVLRPDGGELAHGRHILIVEDVRSASGELVAGGIAVPFLISDTIATIPPGVRLDTIARLAVEELRTRRLSADRRPTESFIEMFKATDRTTGEQVRLAFDHEGNRIDADEMLQSVARNRAARFGKVGESLHERIEAAPDEPVTVAVWLRTSARAERIEKSPHAPATERHEVENQEMAEARELSQRFRQATAGYGAEVDDPDPDAPMLILTLPANRVRELAEREDVAGVLLHATDEILDLGTSMSIAGSDRVQALGVTGSGVNVAVWENGPDQVTQLPIAATFDTAFMGTSQHARHTHAIVSNIQAGAPHGHAPGCTLHSANRDTIAALRWAARDRGCTVISQSFHRSTEPSSGDMQSDDVYKDWLALRWPYPTVVQAAGNYFTGDSDGIDPPANEFVNHKTYNGLMVGNHDDTATTMSGDSVFRNPTSPRHDRELPEISANGSEVTTVGLTMSGTSMAAPAVAGCVALLQEADHVLQSWPEACRAIVLAGAQRLPDNRTWFGDLQDGVDAAQGAGAIDVRASLDIVRARQLPNNAAARCGWDAGTLNDTNVGSDGITTFQYTVIAPGLMYQPYLKVALAWDSTVRTSDTDMPLTSFQDADLDLLVRDQSGTVVAQSSSWDNTYEIAEMRCRPGRMFTITIRRYAGDRPIYYSIAWMVSSRPVFVRHLDGARPAG